MTRDQYFTLMGNNCRLHRMTIEQAQHVIDGNTRAGHDSDCFWEGYHYGTQPHISRLPLKASLVA